MVVLAGCQAEAPAGQDYQITSLSGSQTATGTQATSPSPSPQVVNSSTDIKKAVENFTASNSQEVASDLQAIVEARDYRGCARLTDDEDRETCESTLLISIAVSTKDESICDLATFDEIKQRCHGAFKLPIFKLK